MNGTPDLIRPLRSVVREVLLVAPRLAAGAVGVLLALAAAEGAGIILLGPLLEQVVMIEENPLPRAGGWLDFAFGLVGLEVTLVTTLGLFVGIIGLRAVLSYLKVRIVTTIRERAVHEYRSRLYAAIAAAEWRFLVTRTPSEFVHAMTSEVTRVGSVVGYLTEFTVSVLVAIVYLGLALRLSPPLALVVVLAAAVLAIVLRPNFDRSKHLGGVGAAQRRLFHRTLTEHIASLKTARIYDTTHRHTGEIVELSRQASAVSHDGALADSQFNQSLEFGSAVLLALITLVSLRVLNVSPPLMFVLVFIFSRLMPRLIQIYKLLRGLSTALPMVNELNIRIAELHAAAEGAAADVPPLQLTDGILFDDVSFTYLRRHEHAAVNRLRLHIAAGMTTAIVGPSGSGKSSVADLLIGLLAPTSGRILIDGQPLSPASMSAWRRQIGYVPQDTFLFHDTVRANLCWARPESDDSELWEVLQLAAAADFVAGLPQGLDTVVGERGVLLSGGERQRLAIARALLRKPAVLVLDEATSSLDVEHERLIQRAIDALQHRLTLVIITHRLTTIRRADVIHVMEAGAVVQSGTWDSLHAENEGRFHVFVRNFGLSEGTV